MEEIVFHALESTPMNIPTAPCSRQEFVLKKKKSRGGEKDISLKVHIPEKERAFLT